MDNMDFSLFSSRYPPRPLRDADIPEIFELCRANELYYKYCPPFVTEDSIARDMAALPPKKYAGDKLYLGFFDGEKLIAVLDLILGYPDEETAFIGFFMVDVSLQNAGVGSEIVSGVCSGLSNLGFLYVRLGWVSGNPQARHFWIKNGFQETGITYDTERYRVVVAQRHLKWYNGDCSTYRNL